MIKLLTKRLRIKKEELTKSCKNQKNEEEHVNSTDTFLSKIPIAPCSCQMMGQTLKEEIRIAHYNNPTKAGKYTLEDLFIASDNIPHHYPEF